MADSTYRLNPASETCRLVIAISTATVCHDRRCPLTAIAAVELGAMTDTSGSGAMGVPRRVRRRSSRQRADQEAVALEHGVRRRLADRARQQGLLLQQCRCRGQRQRLVAEVEQADDRAAIGGV